jgi:hypothetical protein
MLLVLASLAARLSVPFAACLVPGIRFDAFMVWFADMGAASLDCPPFPLICLSLSLSLSLVAAYEFAIKREREREIIQSI